MAVFLIQISKDWRAGLRGRRRRGNRLSRPHAQHSAWESRVHACFRLWLYHDWIGAWRGGGWNGVERRRAQRSWGYATNKRSRGTNRETLLAGGFGTTGIEGRSVGSGTNRRGGRKRIEGDNIVHFRGLIRGERVRLVREIRDPKPNTWCDREAVEDFTM